MLAEEVYFLDNTPYIETESFVCLRGHSTVMARRRAFVDWKKRCNILLSYPEVEVFAFHWGCTRLGALGEDQRGPAAYARGGTEPVLILQDIFCLAMPEHSGP